MPPSPAELATTSNSGQQNGGARSPQRDLPVSPRGAEMLGILNETFDVLPVRVFGDAETGVPAADEPSAAKPVS